MDFLDGIRGFAALYVVLFHASLAAGHTETKHYSLAAKVVVSLVRQGGTSVAIFIVLSGFVLGAPVARTVDKKLKGGFLGYIRRRARRILPPYYAALLLFVALIGVMPILQTPRNTQWDGKIPVTLGAVISHLLLVHNFRYDWTYKIDGAMWSIATEWQIYFLYPFILLPIWRRFGPVAMALAGVILSATLLALAPHLSLVHLTATFPQYIALFAFGAAGSAVCFSQDPLATRLRKLPWTIISAACFALTAAVYGVRSFVAVAGLNDMLIGIAVTALLINLTLAARTGQSGSRLLRLFSSRFALFLGLFSYSIYLIHSPLLSVFNLLTLDVPLSDDFRLFIMEGIAAPLAILASYVFYLLVERRFLNPHQKTLKRTLTADPHGAAS